ncbi:MAG: ribbon-helix-helix domain-containing protein [Alphaproteobacteria bacterium]|nr:ribbon-helix-helix domain-containing protein [Alphaproteobacteria bacterium]
MGRSEDRAILRNVRIAGRRTSIKLEAAMWEALFELCARTGLSLDQVCALAACKRRGKNPSLKRPDCPVAPE